MLARRHPAPRCAPRAGVRRGCDRRQRSVGRLVHRFRLPSLGGVRFVRQRVGRSPGVGLRPRARCAASTTSKPGSASSSAARLSRCGLSFPGAATRDERMDAAPRVRSQTSAAASPLRPGARCLRVRGVWAGRWRRDETPGTTSPTTSSSSTRGRRSSRSRSSGPPSRRSLSGFRSISAEVVLLEVVFAILYAGLDRRLERDGADLRSNPCALRGLAPARVPGLRDAVSTRRRATRCSRLGSRSGCCSSPGRWRRRRRGRFVALGAAFALLVLTRPANQVLLLPLVLAPLIVPCTLVAAAHVVGCVPCGGNRPARDLGSSQRGSLRRHDGRAGRPCMGALSQGVSRRPDRSHRRTAQPRRGSRR